MRDVFPMIIGSSRQTLPYLSLGMVMAHLRSDGTLSGCYHLQKSRPGGTPEFPLSELLDVVLASDAPVCLFSSYVWNHELNLSTAERVKSACPRATIIFGGPHVPRHTGEAEEFLEDYSFIDIAVLGEGEIACAEILAAIAKGDLAGLERVTGIAYRKDGAILRTRSRTRLRDIDELSSPYLEGEFDPWLCDFPLTVLETNRGCPFGCTYCDWGSATLQKVSKFNPERVCKEIDYLCDKRSKAIFIADANFGMLEQDIAIAQKLAEAKARTGYPERLFTNFAKNGGNRLLTVIEILHRGGLLPTGIIALQTTDPDVLNAIDRDNIRTTAYEHLMEHFHRAGIPMASDLMIGLPGQTPISFANDLQFCFDWKVSAHGNYTSMMPNAPMAQKDYREHWQIETDSKNLITSTASFSKSDMTFMQDLYTTYQFFVRLGVFRHGLYCLQSDFDVPAIMFLRAWLEAARTNAADYPLSSRVWGEILDPGNAHADWAMLRWSDNAHFLFDEPAPFYRELISFAEQQFTLDIPAQVSETLVLGQSAVMPHRTQTYPITVQLPLDLAGYMAEIRSAPSLADLPEGMLPLSARSAGSLLVTAPLGVPNPLKFATLSGHADEWELPSALAFHATGVLNENTA